MVLFQALTWEARDIDDEYVISIFGRSDEGKSVCVSTVFNPYFFIKIKRTSNDRLIFQKIQKMCPSVRSYELLQAKDVWGFQNNEKFPYMKLNFKTFASMKVCDRKLQKPLEDEQYPEKVYESNIDPVLRFMHRTGIQSTGWIDTGSQCVRNNIANVDIDLFCNDWKTLKSVARDGNTKFVVGSFDIETYSSTGLFPDADVPGDAVFQIAITLRRLGEKDIYKRVCLCYKPTEADNVTCFESERDLLMGFHDFLMKSDVDIMTGWNIFGFDLEYIYKRAVISRCPPSFFQLGKLKGVETEMVYKRLSSSALGDNLLKLLPMAGRFVFDLFHEVKREQKLDSYSLNHVSEVFLKDKKIDVSPKEMFAAFKSEDPKALGRVAEYCIKDTELPHRLMDKLCTLLNLIEMAKATWVPLCYLSERGQQIKVFSQLSRKARELGFMVPTIRYGKVQSDPYEGATVLEAQTGAYYRPITALDFASLYPSIMMAHNLCYSTLVIDPKYANVPGVEYEEFKVGERTYKFAQNVPSLLPAILNELKAFRKQAKKDMVTYPDMYDVYNGKQLAYKISMNSAYGFTGAGKGILPCVPIASTVTARGREMIEETKNYVEEHFPGAKVRYGDSVTPDTPLLVRQNNQIKTCRIDSLVSGYELRDDGKEIAIIDAEVWTENGFTPIIQIVRHKTTKSIHRVLTHTGVVDVTEDHSLLLENKEMITPGEVSIGTRLLHGNCADAFSDQPDSVTVKEAKVMGFFFGDGSCGYYNGKYTWTLNNSNIEYLEEMKSICSFETRIYDTMRSSGVYKLNAIGDVKTPSEKYRKLFYNDHKEKVVPPCILNASMEVIQSFCDGYYMADGDKDIYTRMDVKGKEGSMGMFILGKLLGYNVSINTRSDKPNVFRQSWTKSNQRRVSTAIKKLELLGETHDYVYDLTTASHHFHIGPGEMVVHNTDSVMVEFDTTGMSTDEALQHSWKLGEQAAEECTKLFKKPNDLELEKVYWPYFLYSKKRYAAKLWTKGKDGNMKMNYVDIKGLQVVRRDGIAFTRETCKELFDIILDSNNPEAAKELAVQRGTELIDGRVPMDKLVLSQKLADSYKNQNMAHVCVRNKIREREPGSEPQSGDRVPYVITDTGNAKAKMFEKAEDPKYVKDNGVPLDYQYYFTNKFMTPVCDLLEPLVEDPKNEIFGGLLPKKKTRGKTIDQMFKVFNQ